MQPADLLPHAWQIARQIGVANVTAAAIAQRAGVARQTVHNVLGDAQSIRWRLVRRYPELTMPESFDHHESIRLKRDRTILAAAVQLARNEGLTHVTRDRVAHTAGYAPSTISNYRDGGSMIALRTDVVTRAVEQQIVPIVRDALGLRMVMLDELDEPLRSAVLA